MTSLRGHLLVASPKLLDPNFARTVVLLVQHNKDGALGLVLNRPLETSLKEAWEQVSEVPCEAEVPLYAGGPCEGPLMAVHTHPAYSEMEVIPGLHFCTERQALEQLVSLNHSPARFFVGYAGWSPGQIEGELEEGAWLTAPADLARVFGSPDENLWLEAFRAITSAMPLPGVNPKTIPEDPSYN